MLKEIEKYAKENFVPIAMPETAKFLEDTCKKLKPKNILEIGTAIGYSGSIMLLASENATLTTLERDAGRAKLAIENFKKLGVYNRVNLIQEDATEYLKKPNDTKYDLVFLDGNKSRYVDQLPYILDKMADKALIIADNILFHGMVMSEEYPAHKHRTAIFQMRKFIDLAKQLLDNYKLLEIGDGLIVGNKKN